MIQPSFLDRLRLLSTRKHDIVEKLFCIYVVQGLDVHCLLNCPWLVLIESNLSQKQTRAKKRTNMQHKWSLGRFWFWECELVRLISLEDRRLPASHTNKTDKSNNNGKASFMQPLTFWSHCRVKDHRRVYSAGKKFYR